VRTWPGIDCGGFIGKSGSNHREIHKGQQVNFSGARNFLLRLRLPGAGRCVFSRMALLLPANLKSGLTARTGSLESVQRLAPEKTINDEEKRP
jgi:hypothetical protein